MPQTSYASRAVAREGQLADSGIRQIDSYVAEADNVKAGLLAQQGTGDRQCKPLSALATADVDAIVATLASASSAQILTSDELDGATGKARMSPAKSVTLVLDSHTDWDASTAHIWGIDAAGNPIDEDLAIPNNGNVTVTTKRAYSRVTRLDIPAQSGTGGSATVGVSNTVVEVGKATHPGVVVYDPAVEPGDSGGEFDQYEQVNMLRKGRFYAVPEHAVVPGEEVYVRVAEVSTDLRGQFTGDDGHLTPTVYAKVLGANWRSSASADGLAELEIDFT